MAQFQKGDVVRLKSGGPRMTVLELGDFSPRGPSEGVKCVWFDRKRREEDVFDAAVLEKDDDTGGFAFVPIVRS